MKTVRTDARRGFCFVIQKIDKQDQLKYFGGFYNETTNNETESEEQCWENESWTDDIDFSQMFDTFAEARDWYNQLQSKYNVKIYLYGYNPNAKSMANTNWYPLKEFKIGKSNEED